MRTRLLFLVAILGLLVFATWGPLRADEGDDAGLRAEIKALRSAVLRLGGEIHDLRAENHQLRLDFERHSHPVKIWNGRRRQVTSWKDGTYFIGLPAVGTGATDQAARRAGGTWGTP
jgi:hypothetical protein